MKYLIPVEPVIKYDRVERESIKGFKFVIKENENVSTTPITITVSDLAHTVCLNLTRLELVDLARAIQIYSDQVMSKYA